MATVIITIVDGEDGITDIDFHSDPPVDTQDMDSATDAQLLALGFIAETVQSAAEITHFNANGEDVPLG